MSGAAARIGFLWPADGLNDDEYLAFLPPGLAWLTARYDAGTETEALTREVLSAYASPAVMTRAARMLAACRPDVVACGDHAASFILGAAGEAAMAGAMRDTLGCPAVTMGAACLDALAALGARRIAVVSPYSETVTGALCDYLTAAGDAIVSARVEGATSEEEIGPRAPEDWRRICLDALRASPRPPDAVLLAGGGVRFAAAIDGFEAETGVPVVTGPGALVRAAARAAGRPHARPGRGRLFREAPEGAIATIAARQSSAAKSFALTDAPPVFVAGSGARLIDEAGRGYLDFATGSGTVALGHGHPAIRAALDAQSDSGVLHVGPHFHTPAQARLYDRLGALLPAHLDRYQPATGGAEATEAAIKAAMHATGARRFIGFEGGYHGRTFGALAVSGARGANAALAPFAPETEILPFPADREAGEAAARRIAEASGALAGVVVEVVQATAGLRVADPSGLAAIARAARKAGAALIVDEVFTGFGRTGRVFAHERYDLEADLLILGKSFGGGMPAGLVAGRTSILSAWPAGAQSATFQLHPAAAATALAFLDVLERDGLAARADALETVLRRALAPLADAPGVTALRGLGAFHVVETTDAQTARRARRRALEDGLVTWACGMAGEGVGLVPPLTVSDAEISEAASILRRAFGVGER
jgi:4-aminobutyrate aminotransferase-like enzyme/maleate cis-trans isomerase